MNVKQKPLSRRKSYKYFTSDIPENIDDFWQVAVQGDIDNEVKDDTLDFPESSAINDSSLKFKKTFAISEAHNDFNILSEKEDSSNQNESSIHEKENLIEEVTNREKEKLTNQEIENLTNQNDFMNYDFDIESFTLESKKEEMRKTLPIKKKKQPVLKEKTNLKRNKSLVKPNESVLNAYIPDKSKVIKKSSIIKSKTKEILAVKDAKRFTFDKNCHTKIKKINKTEVAIVNLSLGSKIKDQLCNRNMIITILKGVIKIEFDDNSFVLKSGGMCFINRECNYSIYGEGLSGSVFQIVYVK